MAQWDLFVDESGSFNRFDDRGNPEHNVVGGFILPRGVYSGKLASQWAQEIRTVINGRYGGMEIQTFNRYNPWKVRDQYRNLVAHEEFDFTHACNNHFVRDEDLPEDLSVSARERNDLLRSIQLDILDGYARRILAQKGRIVIFDEPAGLDFGGNTPTYLTIIGKGITILYNQLQLLYDDPQPELFCHIARRTNEERDYEGQRTETGVITLQQAPGGNINRIEKEQYQKTIRNMAFAIASNAQRESGYFRRIIEQDDYLDIVDDGQSARMIPCDYICNSYYRSFGRRPWMSAQAYRDAFVNSDNAVIIRVSDVDKLVEDDFIAMMGSRSYLDMLLRIKNLGYQREDVNRFFECFNRADIVDQRAFVSTLAEYYYKPTSDASTNGTLAMYVSELTSLLGILQYTDPEDHTVRERIADPAVAGELRAHINLYLNALYTHMCMYAKVEATAADFERNLARMAKDQARANLQVKYLNRRIVTYTDSFRYDDAERAFEKLNSYWEYTLMAREDIFGELADAGATTSEEYGREIGSWLQLVQHRMRSDRAADREALYAQARPFFEKMLSQFSSAADVCRGYTNIGAVEREAGRFASAFACLYKAARAREGVIEPFDAPVEIDAGRCAFIIAVSRSVGETLNASQAYPWLIYHYIRLAQEMLLHDDPQAKILCEPLMGGALREESFDWIGYAFLRAIIQWRAAGMLTAQGLSPKVADQYFKGAGSAMTSSDDMTFIAIGLAAQLEWISSLIRQKRFDALPSPCRSAKGAYERYLASCRGAQALDIFDDGGEPPLPAMMDEIIALKKNAGGENAARRLSGLGERCFALSRRVAY